MGSKAKSAQRMGSMLMMRRRNLKESFDMPRIFRLTRNEVLPGAVTIYDPYLRDRGNVPNMFRTMAQRPERGDI